MTGHNEQSNPSAMLTFINHPSVVAVRYLQFGLAVALFFYAAWMPSDNAPSNIAPEVMHFVGNLLLLLSLWVASLGKMRMIYVVVSCVFLSMLAESGQHFRPDRELSLADFAVNLVGLAVGWLVVNMSTRLLCNLNSG